ncbi:hypothetical protein GCM10022408_29300 [Hymenobacter fastidiosus]|uniref:Polymer-forming cytoskeletal protein n=1 Tax=Hymenobacter fastidiosus TaxID=486264 RepID=A0ABP7SNT0_9BACT
MTGNTGGSAGDFYGNAKVGFELTGKINRKDCGLSRSGVTEAGSIVISEDVKLSASGQFTKHA